MKMFKSSTVSRGPDVEPEAEDHQIEVLKFFKVPIARALTLADAQRQVLDLLSDPEAKARWDNRGANKEQKDIYKFFIIPIPKNWKHKDAKYAIDELFDDETKLDAWDEHFTAIEDRIDWFDYAREDMNEWAEDYGSKKIGKKAFNDVVAVLEESGLTLEQIENDEKVLFVKALEMFPNLERRSPYEKHHVEYSRDEPLYETVPRKRSKLITILFLLAVIILVFSFIIREFGNIGS